MLRIMDSRARTSFETGTGFTVIGQRVRSVLYPGVKCEVFEANLTPRSGRKNELKDQHVRIFAPPQGFSSSSILIEFYDGSGTCLAVLPGFIGSVVVDRGVVVNVNYTPSSGTRRYGDYLQKQNDVDKRCAFAAAASERGFFTLDRATAQQFSGYIRQLKDVDPTLGLYAAYGYVQGGLRSGAQSVCRYMREDFQRDPQDPVPVLFDVVLLGSDLNKKDLVSHPPKVAPFCPLLTQGWALLGNVAKNLHPLVREEGRHLAPALWTTFSDRGVALIRDALMQGGGVKPK